MKEPAPRIQPTLLPAVGRKWSLYVFEGLELALFMLSACAGTVILFDPSYPALHLLPSAPLRRLLMGAAMGITAVLIIHSRMGERSGAHFNPAITLTYLRLRKIAFGDAALYVLFQFLGGIGGVAVAAILLGPSLADPEVDYAVTIPGRYGTTAAFAAELFMAAVLMAVVLWMTNRVSLSAYASYAVGLLIALDVFFFAPVSGFSINPARTVGSAVPAQVWTAAWLYFVAPVLGMLGAAEVFVRRYGAERILCAHLRPNHHGPCPFLCQFPGHRHDVGRGLAR